MRTRLAVAALAIIALVAVALAILGNTNSVAAGGGWPDPPYAVASDICYVGGRPLIINVNGNNDDRLNYVSTTGLVLQTRGSGLVIIAELVPKPVCDLR